MQSLMRHHQQQKQQASLPDSSPSLKLPLQLYHTSGSGGGFSEGDRTPRVWNGGELCGGKLSPMHLDCCMGDDSTGIRGSDRLQDNDQHLLQNRTQSVTATTAPAERQARLSVRAGSTSDQEAVIGSWPPLPPKGIRKKAAETLGFSAVAMEMLREQEDRDLHPFGRGGRFEGVLYSRRVKVQVDHTKFLAWIVFASFILLTSGAIIFLAEMERRQKSQQSLLSTTSSTIDGLLHSNNNATG